MNDDNVVLFSGVTSLDLPAERVLKAAINEPLKVAVVLGYTEEGEEYFASSVADLETVVWLLERLKYKSLSEFQYVSRDGDK